MRVESLLGWVNYLLSRFPEEKVQPIKDLKKGLKDGVVLSAITKVLFGHLKKGHKWKIANNPRNKQQATGNLDQSLKFLKQFGLKTQVTPDDLYLEKGTSAENLVKDLIKFVFMKAGSGLPEMQKKLNKSLSFDVEIKDFGKSWASGDAFAALVAFMHSGFDYFEQANKTPEEKLQSSFDFAAKQFKIPQLLSIDQARTGDEQSILIYLSLLIFTLFLDPNPSLKKPEEKAIKEKKIAFDKAQEEQQSEEKAEEKVGEEVKNKEEEERLQREEEKIRKKEEERLKKKEEDRLKKEGERLQKEGDERKKKEEEERLRKEEEERKKKEQEERLRREEEERKKKEEEERKRKEEEERLRKEEEERLRKEEKERLRKEEEERLRKEEEEKLRKEEEERLRKEEEGRKKKEEEEREKKEEEERKKKKEEEEERPRKEEEERKTKEEEERLKKEEEERKKKEEEERLRKEEEERKKEEEEGLKKEEERKEEEEERKRKEEEERKKREEEEGLKKEEEEGLKIEEEGKKKEEEERLEEEERKKKEEEERVRKEVEKKKKEERLRKEEEERKKEEEERLKKEEERKRKEEEEEERKKEKGKEPEVAVSGKGKENEEENQDQSRDFVSGPFQVVLEGAGGKTGKVGEKGSFSITLQHSETGVPMRLDGIDVQVFCPQQNKMAVFIQRETKKLSLSYTPRTDGLFTIVVTKENELIDSSTIRVATAGNLVGFEEEGWALRVNPLFFFFPLIMFFDGTSSDNIRK